MKRKNKRLSLIAIFALACTFSATVFAGCGGEHVHSYTEWGSNATQHWKECKDGAVDESTRTDHVFIAGECECGAKEQTGPTEEDKYGAVTGSVRLYKYGEYVTDALSGVQVDMGDDDVEISGSVKDGKYTFNVENVKVGKLYELTITRAGYQSYTTEILLDEEGEKPNIGGDNGITLNYEVFGILEGYDAQYHDLTHVNDADPYIVFAENPGGKTLNVLTNDKYGDVSATLRVKFNNSGHSFHTQGIILKFEDGKHLIVRYHNGDQVNGNIQYCDAAWASTPKENTLFGDDAQLNQYGENAIHTLLNAETAAIKADGLDLTVILNDGALYTFFAGNFVAKYGLPEGYADKKVQIAYFAWDAASNARFDYDITEEIPALQSAIDIDVTNPADGTVCTVTATPQKEVYELGEQVELTFAAPEGYKLDALTVGGVDRINDVVGGKLTVKADKIELNIAAAFVKEEPIALDLTVKGKKLGTTAALADGTTVTFKNTDYTFTVAGGKITAPSVVKGRYIVKVAGYYEKEIVLDEQLTEVTLEYDTFKEILHWGKFDLDDQNETTPSFGITNDCAVILTNDTHDTVKASIYLKGDNQKQGNGAVVFRFVGEGMAQNGEVVVVNMEGTTKIRLFSDKLWDNCTPAIGVDGTNMLYFIECDNDGAHHLADEHGEEYLTAYEAGTLKLSVLRDGNTFYVYLNDRFIGKQTVDAKYADAKCEVGFMTADLGNTSEWKYWNVEVDGDPAERAAATVTDGTAENANGTIAISPEAVKIGDTVTVKVTPNEGYKLNSLTVSGGITAVETGNNTYAFVVADASYTVTATFVEEEPIPLELTVKGKKLGTTAALADDTTVTFKNTDYTFTVTDGKISHAAVPKGTYTVVVNGYIEKEIVFDEQLTEVTLEYEMLLSSAGDRGGVDLSQMNEQGGKIIAVGNTLNVNVTTAASYTVVQATAKFDILDDYADKQRRYGIYLKFGDDKDLRVDLDLHENGNNYVLQETNWSTMQGFNWGWVKTYTDAEVSAFVQNGFTYTLVRNAEKVLIICNGEHIRTYILPDAYKDVGAYVGFIMDGNNSDGTKGFTYSVSDSISDVAITDETDNEYGSLTFTPEAVKLGDTVTVTVTPVQGYMFDSLTVTGATVTPAGNNAYTFVAVLPSHTVTATFKDIPAQKAELALSAIGLNSAAISLDGERVTLTPATGMPVELVVENGKIGGYLATGSYTLTLGGYYSAEVEVNADGVFTQTELTLIKKIFEFNGIRETESNLKTDDENLPNVADSTGAATNGKISVKGEGKIYEWSVDEYDDVAVSFTFKNVSDKERGITLLVAHQRTVAVRFQKDGDNGAKLQWYGDWFGGWFWGTQSVVESFEFGGGTAYLNPLDSDLLNKYNGDGLKVTLLRKGEMVYAIVDGKLYSAVLLGQYANSKIKVGIFDQKTTGTYDIPFTIDTDVDAILQAALQSENKVLSVLGNWTVTDTTLAVTGNGFAEIYNRAETYKESLEITIAAQNSGAEKKQQGILYRFENGDWFSFRFEQSYLQYSESAYISTLSTRSNGYNRGILKNWALIKDFSAEQTTLFNGDGIALKLVRSGNDFVIILGDTVVDSFSLDAKYADMKGTAAVVVENGSGKAFAYEYKSGDAALAGLSAVTVSFDGDNKNYTASVDKKYAFAGDEVKITVNSAFSSWSFVPVSIKINGEEKLSDFTRTSVEAGLAKYELTVAVTADTQVVVTVGADTTVEYRASVNNVEYGTVKCDMELAETPSTVYYWNDNCTLTITANDGYALEKLVIGEVEITEGWTENNGVYTYSFKVTGDINAVAHFAAAQTQPETQPDEQQ